MLSTFPVNTLSSDHFLPNLFPLYEPDLPPWEWQEPPAFVFPLQPDQEQDVPPQEQLISNSDSDSDSDNSKPNHAISSSGSDDREPNDNNSKPNHAISSSGSRTNLADERKRKRMLSNRESARRSRMRRKKHLEDLMCQVNQLRVENRELANHLRSVTQRCIVLQTNNERIRAESSELRQRLWDIRLQELLLRQHPSSSAWPCNNVEHNDMTK